MKKRLGILKTYKLYIGGKFPRSESGRYYQIKTKGGVVNVSRASRKDLRDAVRAAREAFEGWSSKTAYLRGQILYRIAEMVEKRKAEFVDEIDSMMKRGAKAWAMREVEKSIDRLVWYAGWSDKFAQIFGTVNPVALPYFNFTIPEPTGIIGIICPEELALLPLVSKMAPAIVSGNTCVILASEKWPLSAITFAEVLQTSDLPAGVVNILSGFKKELLPILAKHMDVNAIDYSGNEEETRKLLQEEGSANVKRVILRASPYDREWFEDSKSQSPYWIESTVEMKTTWHPVGV